MRLYAITDAARLPASPETQEEALVKLAEEWAAGGVEVIQIREPQMTSCALERLARHIVAAVRDVQAAGAEGVLTRVLINGRVDVAIAAGADGVHLPGSGSVTPAEVRQLYAETGRRSPIVSVACHSVGDVIRARENAATIALFAPVFGKALRPHSGRAEAVCIPGQGVAALRAACDAAGAMPVFALGGVTTENAQSCLDAGAAGVAAIRLFSSPQWQSLR